MSLDETFLTKIAERYDRRSRYLTQLVVATALFAMVFFAFILIPLVSLQHDEMRIGEELDSIQAEQAAAGAKLEELENSREAAKSGLAELTASLVDLELTLESLVTTSAELTGQIEQAQLAIEEKAQELVRLDEQREEFKRFRTLAETQPGLDVDGFVTELQEFLRQARSVLFGGGPIEDLDIEVDCPNPDRDERLDCVVHTKVMQMLSTHVAEIRGEVAAPVRAIDETLAEDLETRLGDVLTRFEDILAERPNFWLAVTLKFHIGERFREELATVSREIGTTLLNKVDHIDHLIDENKMVRMELAATKAALATKLGDLQRESIRHSEELNRTDADATAARATLKDTERKIADLKREIGQAEAELAKLSGRQNKIAENKAAITDRLNKVDSPFGTLPISLVEALQVFPIIFAAGLITAGLVLAELIRLRFGYHMRLRQTNPSELDKIDQAITLTAPLYLDPCRPSGTNLWRGWALTVPATLYVASIALIAYSWSLDGEAEGAGRTVENGYLAAYLILGALLAVPAVHVSREWRLYRAALTGEQSTAAAS